MDLFEFAKTVICAAKAADLIYGMTAEGLIKKSGDVPPVYSLPTA